jgi:hypothetical protein
VAFWPNQTSQINQGTGIGAFSGGSFVPNAGAGPNNNMLFMIPNQNELFSNQNPQHQLMMSLAGFGGNGQPKAFEGMGIGTNQLIGQFGMAGILNQQPQQQFGVNFGSSGFQNQLSHFKNDERCGNSISELQQKLGMNLSPYQLSSQKPTSYLTPSEVVIPKPKTKETSNFFQTPIQQGPPKGGAPEESTLNDIKMLYKNISFYVSSVMKFKTKELVCYLAFDPFGLIFFLEKQDEKMLNQSILSQTLNKRFKCTDILKPVLTRFGLDCKFLEEVSQMTPDISRVKSEENFIWVPQVRYLMSSEFSLDRRLSRMIALFLFDMDYHFPPLIYIALIVIMASVELSKDSPDSLSQEDQSSKEKAEGSLQSKSTESEEDKKKTIVLNKHKIRSIAAEQFAAKHIVIFLNSVSSWSVSNQVVPNGVNFPSKNEVEALTLSVVSLFVDWVAVYNFGFRIELKDR